MIVVVMGVSGCGKTTIGKLNRTEWPSRFQTVANETRQLQEQLPK